MNYFKNNIAIQDFFFSIINFRSWAYLATFDLKIKYRRAFLGPWWVVLGIAISAGLLCLLWSTIFNLDWKTYLSYIFSGFIIWTWITSIVVDAPQVFYAKAAGLIKAHPTPPVFHVFRLCYLNLLLFLHHLPLIIIVIVLTNTEIHTRTLFTLPIGLFLVFINSILFSSIIGILSARYRDTEPTVKALMAPMLLLTPVLWKPEMLGAYEYFIYLNPFTYFLAMIRNDLIGLDFDEKIWIGAVAITFIQALVAFYMYCKKRNRIVFWI